jgi:hypothetical protein
MSFKKTVTTVDVRGFINFFGGPASMRSLWESQGLHLTKGAQDKWVMRCVVPTSRVLEAVQVARKKRMAFNFNQFVCTRKTST